MADGEAATGAIRLLRMAHATVAGIGILIEKSFQPGRRKINEQGYEVYSLARIKYCLLYTSPSPRDRQKSRMPSSA